MEEKVHDVQNNARHVCARVRGSRRRRIRRGTLVNAAEVRETMNKSSQVCARVRVGEHPVSREAAVSCEHPVSWVSAQCLTKLAD